MATVEQVGAARPHRKAPFWTVNKLRIAGIVVLVGLWEAAGASGLFFQGVLPSSVLIVKALFSMMVTAGF